MLLDINVFQLPHSVRKKQTGCWWENCDEYLGCHVQSVLENLKVSDILERFQLSFITKFPTIKYTVLL